MRLDHPHVCARPPLRQYHQMCCPLVTNRPLVLVKIAVFEHFLLNAAIAAKTAILTKINGLLVTNGQVFWSYCPSVSLAHVWG